LRELAVFVVSLIFVFVTAGAIGRGEMILLSSGLIAKIVVVALDAIVLVVLGMKISGGLRAPNKMSRLLMACLVAAVLICIGAAGAWLWLNLPDQRVQVLTGFLGIAGLGVIALLFGSLIGGPPHPVDVRWDLVVPGLITIAAAVDIVLARWFIDYPSESREIFHYVWCFMVALFPFAFLDMLWIKFVMEKPYKEEMGIAILGTPDPPLDPKNDPIPTHPRIAWGLICWSVICIGLAAFAIVPHGIHDVVTSAPSGVAKQHWQHALAWGAAFGFISSGFYALTCLTAFKHYVPKLAALDVIWGTFLAGLITLYTRAAV
jgi:uncharacterized membrane protein